jgi:type VI secretion system secreted protein VgrG
MVNIGAAYNLNVGAMMVTVVGVNQTAKIGSEKNTTVGKKYELTVGGGGGGSKSNITMDDKSITLQVGKSKLTMKDDGTIQLDGKDISLLASAKLLEDAGEGVQIKGGPSVVVKAETIDLN